MGLLTDLRARVCCCVFVVACSSMLGRAATTSTVLAVSSSSVTAGSALTLTATVTSGGNAVTPGTVTFCDASFTRCTDSGLLGRAQLNGSGVATWKFIPAAGSRSFKAVFSAKTGYSGSASSAVTVSVTGLRASTSVLSSTGSAGNYTLQVATRTVSNNNTAPTGSITFRDGSNSNYTLGTASLGSGSTTPGFSTPGSVNTTVSNLRQSATADFNGDGIPDVAAPGSNSISILLGSSGGTFSAASGSPISISGALVHAATGDFNGDGKADVLVCNWSAGSVTLLAGNGDGTFTNGGATGIISQTSALGVGDFNSDGNLDFAVVSQYWNVARIYLGNGSGSFSYAGTEYATQSQPYSIAVADYNSDGNADLAIGNANASSVTVLLGAGNGSFTAATGSPVAAGSQVWSLVSADLNNDGKPDLIAANKGDNNIGVMLGNGDGTFASNTAYTVAAGTKTVVAADFDADGHQDVAVCNQSTSSLLVFPGSGTGALGTARSTSFGGTGCVGLIAGDWNGDGLPDLQGVTGTYSGALLNTQTQSATATLSSVSIPGNGSHNIQGLFAADSLSAASTSNTLSLTATPVTTTLAFVTNPTSTQWGQQVALSAWVSPYAVGGLAPTGLVTYKNGATTLGTGGVVGAYSQLDITSLPVGTNTLTAVYAGDSNFTTITSSSATVTVSQATGTLSLAASNTGQAYGTSLTFTATLPSAATGTVTFTDGGTNIGTGSASSGSATLSLNSLSVGSHTIGASYGGDTHYSSATASTITVTVVRAAATLLGSASRNPSLYGDAVSLSFQCLGSAATPTGTLLLKDGGTTLATLTLDDSGHATYLTSAFTAGTHALSVTYSGDTRYY